MTSALAQLLNGPCCCDSRYDGCDHPKPCRQPNDGSGRGPWCADCQPRRLGSIGESLRQMAADR